MWVIDLIGTKAWRFHTNCSFRGISRWWNTSNIAFINFENIQIFIRNLRMTHLSQNWFRTNKFFLQAFHWALAFESPLFSENCPKPTISCQLHPVLWSREHHIEWKTFLFSGFLARTAEINRLCESSDSSLCPELFAALLCSNMVVITRV